MWRAATTAATAISPPGRTSSSTGSSSRRCRTRSPISPASRMHAMQTSGNCVRNITTDQWAGVAADEIEDPRIWAEVLRQHSTMHPEFTFLPRKFKIAITAAAHDRAAVEVHDIGLRMIRNAAGEVGFEVMVGGGLGRTPFIGKVIKPFLPKRDFLSYIEAILRVYNQYGRRDNIYKARIKILVHELGAEKFAAEVEKEWNAIKDGALALDPAVIADVAGRFSYPDYERLEDNPPALARARKEDRALRRVARQFGRQPQAAGLRHRHAVAEADRRAARRRHCRADGRHRRPRRPLQLRRDPRRPRAEPGAAACCAARPARALAEARSAGAGDAECRARLRHHRLPGPRLLQPRQCALDPGRAGADRSASAITRWRAPSAACTSIFPAASMPAATTMSATSASSASRRTARSSTRSRSAAAPTRAPRSARCSGRRCATARSPTSSRTWSPPMWNCAMRPRNCSSTP